VLEGFPAETVARFLAVTGMTTAGRVMGQFTPGFAASCLTALEPATGSRILEQLPAENQITLLRQLDPDARDPFLRGMQADTAAALRRLLPWPDGTAGALMEAPLASVPEDLSVRNALKRIKRLRRGMKFYLYATDSQGRLTGVLTLHELLNALPTSTVSQVMDPHVISLSPRLSIPTVLDSPYWKEFHALPVTDGNGVLLGVIRQKSLRRFEEHSLRTDLISGGLGTVLAMAELFSVTVVSLLSVLLATGTPPGGRESG
jgi:magnesium transporter